MTSTTNPQPQAEQHTSTASATGAGRPVRRPLLTFAAVALPTGWVMLSLPIVLHLPQEPFVLATLVLGLLLPALALTAREQGRPGVRALLRDAVRLPRPPWWGLVALVAIPGISWGVAAAMGHAQPLTRAGLLGFAVMWVTGLLIVNLWEETVWTGFVQRRFTARWGLVRGSLLTAVLFAGIHLPLAFAGATSATQVLLGVGVLLGTGVGLRLVIAQLDAWSGRSLLTIGILHASFNSTAGLVDPAYDWVRLAVTVALGLGCLAVGHRRASVG